MIPHMDSAVVVVGGGVARHKFTTSVRTRPEAAVHMGKNVPLRKCLIPFIEKEINSIGCLRTGNRRIISA